MNPDALSTPPAHIDTGSSTTFQMTPIPTPVPPLRISRAFRELAAQFGATAAETMLHPTPNQVRHERRGQEAWARQHYFTLPGRKMRNIIRRKSIADQ
jgi:hypothetical protein